MPISATRLLKAVSPLPAHLGRAGAGYEGPIRIERKHTTLIHRTANSPNFVVTGAPGRSDHKAETAGLIFAAGREKTSLPLVITCSADRGCAAGRGSRRTIEFRQSHFIIMAWEPWSLACAANQSWSAFSVAGLPVENVISAPRGSSR